MKGQEYLNRKDINTRERDISMVPKQKSRLNDNTNVYSANQALTGLFSTNQINQQQKNNYAGYLQNHYGNRGTQMLIQAKLNISQPGDKYEREADEIADQVMKMPNTSKILYNEDGQQDIRPRLRVDGDTKGNVDIDPMTECKIKSSLSQGSLLPANTKREMEERFGMDFSDVRVYNNSKASDAAGTINANAFTLGNHIVFNQGQYSPYSSSGKLLMAHELAHVVQQSNTNKSPYNKVGSLNITIQRNAHEVEKGSIYPRDRRLLHLEGNWLREISMVHRGIESWRTFLLNADDERNALELNAFLALATGHPDYIQTPEDEYIEVRPWRPPIPTYPTISKHEKSKPRPKVKKLKVQEERRRYLAKITPPSESECIKLMVALLSTPDIDLIETGALSPALGYLITLFIKEYYHSAIRYISNMRGKSGNEEEIAKWNIQPDTVADLLEEAGEDLILGAFRSTKRLEPQIIRKTGTKTPSRLHEIGVAGKDAGPSPMDVIQTTALAGAQMACILAFGEALEKREKVGTISDHYHREIKAHAEVLSGVILHQDRIRELNEAIIKMVFRTLTAGLGGAVGTLTIFASAVGKAGVSGATEIGKQGVSYMANFLAGKSGKELRKGFNTAFDNTVQAKLNRITNTYGDIPHEVITVATAIRGAFYHHS